MKGTPETRAENVARLSRSARRNFSAAKRDERRRRVSIYNGEPSVWQTDGERSIEGTGRNGTEGKRERGCVKKPQEPRWSVPDRLTRPYSL